MISATQGAAMGDVGLERATNAPQAYGPGADVRTDIPPSTTIGDEGNFTDQDINGLLSGVAWATGEITFSFPTAASNYGAGYGDGQPGVDFTVMSAEQQAVLRLGLGMVSAYTQLTFREIAETDSVHAQLRMAGSGRPLSSEAYYPGTYRAAGDIWLGTIRDDVPTTGGYAYYTILHELGHALGLKHAHETDVFGALPPERTSTEWSIMAYPTYVGAYPVYQNPDGGAPQSFMPNDIAALQYLYGANFTTRAGDTTYAWSPTSGEIFIDGVGQGAPSHNYIYATIWDGGGIDHYDLSAYVTAMTIDLRPGEWSVFADAQRPQFGAEDFVPRYAQGNIANAYLYQGDPRSLIENATGGEANDTIIGNAAGNRLDGGRGGRDVLIGGAGDDVYLRPLGDTIIEAEDGGDDTVISPVSFSLAAYAYVENLTISGGLQALAVGNALNNRITGGINFDRLEGRDGNDTLSGGESDDTLLGGRGDDVYLDPTNNGFGTGDLIVERAGEGIDTVRSSATWSIASTDHVENIELTGAQAADATGNALANALTGNAGANRLYGGNGADTLDGGGGADTLAGGAGDDVYIRPAYGEILEYLAQGFDRVISDGSFSLATLGNVERLELTGAVPGFLRGNNVANQLVGNGGSNFMSGFDGDDALYGGGGRDTLLGGLGRDTLAPGLERDTIRWDSAAESTGPTCDSVSEFIFSLGGSAYESLDFHVIPTALRATIAFGSLRAASFDTDLQLVVNATTLGAGEAVLFDPSGGDLNIAGHIYLVVDANGVAGYQAGADYVVQFTSWYGTLSLANFI